MTIYDIIHASKKKQIVKFLQNEYGKNWNREWLDKQFKEINKVKVPMKQRHKGEEIEMSIQRSEPYNSKSEWLDICTNQYSLSGRNLEDLLSLPVSENTIKHYTYPQIAGAFIWEITYRGPIEKGEDFIENILSSKNKDG